ncbi:hypothetical protein DICVIV_03356 [Dictyocaulus viviparus]|uniref:Hexosyltransferase n=1 Tax=Dictyocaulus viviparus TaxID=29172 RepID=A0A0D8Y7D3_DICVI|nr:hypothetical protein DICVIV_03356 [Dictyocaulus viviparus]
MLDRVINRLGWIQERAIHCYVHQNVRPIRTISSTWYIPESVYSENYLPDYCSGPVYLISPTALLDILKVSQNVKVFEVEDAFFTGYLAKKAGVKLHHERGIWNHRKSSQECLNGEGTVISYPMHSASPSTLNESWIHLSHLRCRWPIEQYLLSKFFLD